MNEKQIELEMTVMELHNIARNIENTIGSGKLSSDIRGCADRLHALISFEVINGEENRK